VGRAAHARREAGLSVLEAVDRPRAPLPPDREPASPVLRPPATPGEVFRVFNRMALQGFGGVIAVAQRELVEREAWLTREQFLEALSLGQVLPGPNIVNMALMLGDRFHGWRGAAAALAGLLAAPLLIVLALAALVAQWAAQPAVAGALRGMGAVAAGLVIGTALKLVAPLRRNVLGRPLAALFGGATFVLIGVLRWPLAAVVLGLGGIAVAAAWHRLGQSGDVP
jgi:chromate transporter